MTKSEKRSKPLLLFKYGGNAMINEDLKEEILAGICLLQRKGYNIVIVHGGGPFIKEALKEAKIESEFIDGHRKTTSEAFEYVEMALKGKVNSNIVSLINALGYKAVGLSGKDGNMVTAEKRLHKTLVNGESQEVDLGRVGNVKHVDPELIEILLDKGYIPVITCLASDKNGLDYNINADMFAGHIAGALRASLFLVLTDVDGLLANKDDPESIINKVSIDDLKKLKKQNIIEGGMIPKVESCEIALKLGAEKTKIINGTKPGKILQSVDNNNSGTLFTRK
ncbi:MAG: acetylglutamate kinase [Bacteroidales bacterium]